MAPVVRRTVVVLPAPLGPRRTVTLPVGALKSRSSRARTSPNVLETEENRIATGIPGDIGAKVPALEGKNDPVCGRFVQAQPPDWYAGFLGVDSVMTEALQPSWNVAPTDRVYAVATHHGSRQLGAFSWGLLPFWAKDRRTASRNINARAETVATKPAFRDSFTGKRCLIPADGFYEWERR
ncbi:MAG: SOS response-associated peptidase, partial [Actinobacteria bacterium]